MIYNTVRDRKSVIITGASSGIGRESALLLDQLGFRVFAGVRKEKDAISLQQQASDQLVPIFLDVSNPDSISTSFETILNDGHETTLIGLINNAGIAIASPLEFIPVDLLRKQLEINVIGQLAVTQAFLPLLRKSKGRVINMGSISGLNAFPLTGPYAISKFALEAMTDSLRVELRPWGVKVIIIEPGAIATPIWEKSLKRKREVEQYLPPWASSVYRTAIRRMEMNAIKSADSAPTPKIVAQTVKHALTSPRPKTRYLVGVSPIKIKLLRILPDQVRDWLIAKALGIPANT